MDRDEAAKEYAEKIAGGPLHDQSWNYVFRDFQAGWDAALLHDERVKKLVETLERIQASFLKYPARREEFSGCSPNKLVDIILRDEDRAREALKKWRGE